MIFSVMIWGNQNNPYDLFGHVSGLFSLPFGLSFSGHLMNLHLFMLLKNQSNDTYDAPQTIVRYIAALGKSSEHFFVLKCSPVIWSCVTFVNV